MSDAASDLLDSIARKYVEQDFPNHRAWSFSFAEEQGTQANELLALGFLERFAQRGFRLSDPGQQWVMSNRPDLDGEPWSDEADDFRDAITARYEQGGFPAHQTWCFDRGSNGRVYNELRALGLIEPVGAGAGWRLTYSGQEWVMSNRG